MKRGYIWTFDSKDFARCVADATNWQDLGRRCGYTHHQVNRAILKKRVSKEGLDTSHFQLLSPRQKQRDFASILIKNSPNKSTYGLKQRLLRKNILVYKCSMCHITDWQNEPISLELDHINGDNEDNRLHNLRLLCPNCHSQTPTFRGKNVVKERQLYRCPCGTLITREATSCNQCVDKNTKQLYKCICGTVITRKSTCCTRCSGEKKRKFETSYDELYDLVHVQKLPFTHIGKHFGVSDGAIRKRCKTMGISIHRCRKTMPQ